MKQCPCFMSPMWSSLPQTSPLCLPSFFDHCLAPFDDGCGPGLPELGGEFGVHRGDLRHANCRCALRKGIPNNVYNHCNGEMPRFTDIFLPTIAHQHTSVKCCRCQPIYLLYSALATESATCPRPSYHHMMNDFRRSTYLRSTNKKLPGCFHGSLFFHLWTLPCLFWFETES